MTTQATGAENTRGHAAVSSVTVMLVYVTAVKMEWLTTPLVWPVLVLLIVTGGYDIGEWLLRSDQGDPTGTSVIVLLTFAATAAAWATVGPASTAFPAAACAYHAACRRLGTGRRVPRWTGEPAPGPGGCRSLHARAQDTA